MLGLFYIFCHFLVYFQFQPQVILWTIAQRKETASLSTWADGGLQRKMLSEFLKGTRIVLSKLLLPGYILPTWQNYAYLRRAQEDIHGRPGLNDGSDPALPPRAAH